MTLKNFQEHLVENLIKSEQILHILKSDNSILINCIDESNFLINIIESKFTFLHNNTDDEKTEAYILEHTKNNFAQDLLLTVQDHPAFFFYFMIFSKLEEKKILDAGMLYHILDCVIYYEKDLNEFLIRLLAHYKLSNT